MAGPIHVKVVTGEGIAAEDDAVSVVAPGEIGYLGVLRNHAPLVTTLVPGRLTWRRADGTRRTLAVADGLMEIAKNRLTVLTSRVAETAHDR